MNKDIENYIKISKYAGCRFDIIQAGGGNSSVKLNDGTMLIKASGTYLSEAGESYGTAKVLYKKIAEVFKDNLSLKSKEERTKTASETVIAANLTPNTKPSMETFLHAMIDYKYILHSHPIVVNAICCRNNWKEILCEIFNENKVSFAKYKTPGIELASELQQVYKNTKITFLQNHGLIVASNNPEEVIKLTEEVLKKIEEYLKVDCSQYKLTSEIYEMYASLGHINITPYLSEDGYINKNIDCEYTYSLPFCPEKIVYTGYKAINLHSASDISDYEKEYFDIPKVLIYKNKIFFAGENLKKAKETEEVFKFHIMSLKCFDNSEINYLTDNEIAYLCNLETEKYRKKI